MVDGVAKSTEEGEVKTPEQLAEEYTKDWWANLPEAEGMRKSARENFLVGYQAAWEQVIKLKSEIAEFMSKMPENFDSPEWYADWFQRKGCVEGHEGPECFEGFLAGYQAAAPQWISVQSKWPKDGQTVLITEGVNIGICKAVIVQFEGYARLGWEKRFDTGETSHWMPLPQPPKEEELSILAKRKVISVSELKEIFPDKPRRE